MVKKQIKLFDISTNGEIQKEFISGLQELVEESSWIMGNDVLGFEHKFAKFHKNNNCVSLNSGTDALEISLKALGITSKDKVIVPAFSFFATSESVLKLGATPVYADIKLSNLNLDLNSIDEKEIKKSKARLPVHLFGNPADMNEVKSFSTLNNLKVIEDVAQAFGSSYLDKPGTIGDIGCFSFLSYKKFRWFWRWRCCYNSR